ncbi:hypothetical protein [Stenotrophomonas pictorum]|uniref:hypothetical protein n=1 Tax=Stenotrophomonas pictorum TaxID=86184 RepID=UPI000A999372|nr:hypothetical protein [Stenotrophomonas pictorum]
MTGTLGEVRGNFSGESRHHLHSGFDVRGDVGQTVLAIAAGKVSSPAATWTLGGQAEGFSLDTLDYLHMKVGRDAANRPLDAARFQLVTTTTAAWSACGCAAVPVSSLATRWAASTARPTCIWRWGPRATSATRCGWALPTTPTGSHRGSMTSPSRRQRPASARHGGWAAAGRP